MTRRPLAFTALALAAALPARADQPLQMGHHGFVRDGADRAIDAPALPMTFRLFTEATGEASNDRKVWETTCAVRVQGGFYGVVFGTSQCGSDLATSHLPPGESRFLEVTIETQPLTPRLRLAPAPLAVQAAVAKEAEKLGGQSLADLDTRYVRASGGTQGSVTITGDVKAGSFAGDGARLTGLSAGALTGIVPDANLPADLVRQGANGLAITGTVSATGFAGSGAGLTNLDAAALTGVVPFANLPTELARTDRANTFTGTITATGFTGSGAGLTNLDATKLTGTIDDARLPSTLARTDRSNTFTGTITATGFTGSGAGLTNLDSTRLTGTVPFTNLPAAVAQTGQAASFAGVTSTKAIRVGADDSLACTAGGTLRWATDHLEVCNGTEWMRMAVWSNRDGSTSARAASTCLELRNNGVTSSGPRWIDPDGANSGDAPFQAYCDMVTDGGGWTMTLHSWFTSDTSLATLLQKTYAEFETATLGDATSYSGITQNAHYFLRLKSFKAIADRSTTLRFESQNQPIHSVLTGFQMSATYGLDGSNEAAVANEMCAGNTTNCFLNPPGFSARDRDQDRHSGACIASYANVGWWYDQCFSYNAFGTLIAGHSTHFQTYSSKDSGTKYWSWWVR